LQTSPRAFCPTAVTRGSSRAITRRLCSSLSASGGVGAADRLHLQGGAVDALATGSGRAGGPEPDLAQRQLDVAVG
jgi:hypothetical protein